MNIQDELTILMTSQGKDKLQKEITDLEHQILGLERSVNTAMKNRNLSHAKGFKTQIKDLRLEQKEKKLNIRQYNDVQKSIKNKFKVEKQMAAAKNRQFALEKKQAKEAEFQRLKMQRGVLQAGLSIMFFGMMLQRFFQGIAQSSLSTFNQLTQDTFGANNAMNRLGAATQSFRYTIGEAINSALIPLEGWILNLLERTSEWIQQNEKFVGWAVIIGIIIGGMMALAGQITLLLIGLAAAKYAFASAGVAATTAGTAATTSWVAVAGTIAKIAIVWASVIGIISGDQRIIKFVGKVVGFIASMLGSLVFGLFAFLSTIGNIAMMALKGIVYGIVWVIQESINNVIKMINVLIKAYNSIAGRLGLRSIGEIGKVNLTKFINIDREKKEIQNLWSKDTWKRVWGAGKQSGDDFVRGATQLFGRDEIDTKVDLTELDNISKQLDTNLNKAGEAQIMAAEKSESASENLLEAARIIKEAGLDTPATGGKVTSRMDGDELLYGWSSVI